MTTDTTVATTPTTPVITKRPSNERGRGKFSWLDSRHSFSFGNYYDPQHMHFRALRVINEDVITGGNGFPTHPHRDAEIVTYMIRGGVSHRDTAGHAGTITAGQYQYMSAGSGVAHSEYNASATDDAHLLQIWLMPMSQGGQPSYGQHAPQWQPGETSKLIASPDGANGSITWGAAAELYELRLPAGTHYRHTLPQGTGAWLQVVSGSGSWAGTALAAGDGAHTDESGSHTIEVGEDGVTALLFVLW